MRNRSSLPHIQRKNYAATVSALLGTPHGDITTVLLLMLLIGSSATYGNAVADFVSKSNSTLFAILQFPLLAALLWWFLNRQRQRVVAGAKLSAIDPHPGIILPLSNLRPAVLEATQNALEQGMSKEALFASCRHPWQQTLRALQPHLDQLRWIGLLVSPESAQQAPLFLAWMRRELPLPPEVPVEEPERADFNNTGKVVEAMEQLLAKASKHRLHPEQIVVDTTGGQKPVSLAGLLVAMVHDGMALQYVNTNDPYEVSQVTYTPHLR